VVLVALSSKCHGVYRKLGRGKSSLVVVGGASVEVGFAATVVGVTLSALWLSPRSIFAPEVPSGIAARRETATAMLLHTTRILTVSLLLTQYG